MFERKHVMGAEVKDLVVELLYMNILADGRV